MADLVRWLENQRNDLQNPAVALVPEIGTVLRALSEMPDVLLARMSGSGATCFALFETREMAEQGAAELEARHKGWWIRATTLGAAQ